MKALTLNRPWSWAITEGIKRCENRGWWRQSIVGEIIAIHAGQKFDRHGGDVCANLCLKHGHAAPPSTCPMGIVATARVIAVVRVDLSIEATKFVLMAEAAGVSIDLVEWFGDGLKSQRDWAFGPYAWLLDNVRPLATPIPFKGFQQLWNVPPDIARNLA